MAGHRVGGGKLRKQRTAADPTAQKPQHNWVDAGRRSTTVRSQHRRRQPPTRCSSCDATGVRLYQDHIVNIAAGGTDTIANMQWLCQSCHDPKSELERIAGLRAHHERRAAGGRRAVERHPGLLVTEEQP